jgi:hypothetical protein
VGVCIEMCSNATRHTCNSSSYSLASELATPMNSQHRPVNWKFLGRSKNMRRQNERYGAMPVPVATQMYT